MKKKIIGLLFLLWAQEQWREKHSDVFQFRASKKYKYRRAVGMSTTKSSLWKLFGNYMDAFQFLDEIIQLQRLNKIGGCTTLEQRIGGILGSVQ